jgi:hypothetical protein
MSLFSEHEHSAFCEVCSPPEQPLDHPRFGHWSFHDTVVPPSDWDLPRNDRQLTWRIAEESAEYRAGRRRAGRWVFLRNDSQYRQEPV